MAAVQMILGLIVVCFTLYEIFRTVAFPRWAPAKFRISPVLIGFIIWPLWKKVSKRIHSASLRELFLGHYAPICILFLLVVWIISLAIGFSLILLGCTENAKAAFPSFWDALLCANASLFTMGFSDRTPVNLVPRFVMLMAAFFGIGAMAMIISFMFALYSALLGRETRVILIQAHAGVPPSGLRLLLSYADLDLKNDLPGAFATWHTWVAEMLEIHRACPVLLLFRSVESNISWLSSLHAVLDAAAIFLSSLEEQAKGYAMLLHKTGSKTAHDLTLELMPKDGASNLSKQDFQAGLKLLENAGYKLQRGSNHYERFLQLRSSYAPQLEALTEHLSHVPVAWCDLNGRGRR